MSRSGFATERAALIASVTLAAVSGIGFVFVYAVTVRTAPGRLFGDASLRGAILTKSGFAEAVDAVLAVVSLAALLAGIAAIAVTALIRLRRLLGLVAVGLVVAANALSWLLKNHLLSRPDLGLFEITPSTHNSLPSGHTTAVFSVVVAVLFVVPTGWRRPVAAAGGLCAIVTALAAMSAGWHRAGDSIAAFLAVGALAGIAAAAVTVAGTGQSYRARERPAAAEWRRWLWPLTVWSAAMGLCMATGLVLIGPLRTSTVGAVFAFGAGGLLIIATAVAVLLGVLMVLDRIDV